MQVDSVHENGTVLFQDGNAVAADFIIHCTGYYHTISVFSINVLVIVLPNNLQSRNHTSVPFPDITLIFLFLKPTGR